MNSMDVRQNNDSSTTGARQYLPDLRFAVALLIGLIVFLGNFHVVSGTGKFPLVRRISFGYEDAFGSVSDCTSQPWIIASAENGKLCAALQKAGILESDEDRDDRLRTELMEETERIQKELQRMMGR